MRFRTLSASALLLLAPSTLAAQSMAGMHARQWYGMLEIPLLVVAVAFGFLTARALRGGRLGAGMSLIAWGLLVMAVGHLHMEAEALFGINVFDLVLGHTGGQVAWVAALAVTWALTAFGFYRLYRASSQI
ncbi:MAG TPA: hypothetical protein VFL93_06145 [Longimicrobiaceae bacterium]|nr:hypothetical protein [Longimicrobiaceae bacterium]